MSVFVLLGYLAEGESAAEQPFSRDECRMNELVELLTQRPSELKNNLVLILSMHQPKQHFMFTLI